MTRPPKTRQQTKAETRLALIDAAITEFGRHGFDVSLDQLCASAKLTRGAFYVHFADREALIVAVMQHVLGSFVNALTGPLDVKLAIRMFFAAIRARAPVVTGGAGLRFHHVLEACRRSKAIAATYRDVVAKARAALVASVPEGTADMLIAIALGMLAVNEVEIPIELDQLERAMLALI
ncbi:MAG TPA: TetR family transcriptional regulator [Kofleriaceae bacterium]|jgi:AcrR family transcriptional regulator